MSFEDATQALGGAIEADASGTPLEQAPAPSPPQGEPPAAPVQPHHSAEQARTDMGQFAPPAPAAPEVPDTFDGGQFNPDTLPDELKPGWSQLQAAFTRKTQELAQQRQQFDALGDPSVIQQAVGLYQSLQDPDYLREFHSELGQALGDGGLPTPEAAPAQSASLESALAQLSSDPELAPVAESISALRAELDSIKSQQAEREQNEQMANLQMSLAGELQRQEHALRELPGVAQDDVDMAYELSAWYDGNLLQAHQTLDKYFQGRMSRYLAEKGSVAPGTAPLPGQGGNSEIPSQPADLDEALKAALDYANSAGIDRIG